MDWGSCFSTSEFVVRIYCYGSVCHGVNDSVAEDKTIVLQRNDMDIGGRTWLQRLALRPRKVDCPI